MLEVTRALNNAEKREIAARIYSWNGVRIPKEIWTPPGHDNRPMNYDIVIFIYGEIRKLGAND